MVKSDELSRLKIAVDLTRLRPAGEGGGAGALAIAIVRSLAASASESELVLLMPPRMNWQLTALLHETSNVRQISPGAANVWQGRLLSELGVDVLFCPFTSPNLALGDPGLPVVSLVCDLQHVRYPEFFTSDERNSRVQDFALACRRADRIVCISEFTRSVLLANTRIAPHRTTVIPIGRPEAGPPISLELARQVLRRWDLRRGRFLLYPANFWPHKNHRLLLAAFALYRTHHPRSDLKLVCTGALEHRRDMLRQLAYQAGVGDWTVLPGYVPADALLALMQACLAVIFPSLYEGFGMPVLEAMQLRKPVLCSDRASLPEVAGDAAVYFDPERILEIVAAIERIDGDLSLATRLAALGVARAARFSTMDDMARAYWQVFTEVVGGRHAPDDAVFGAYPDGWTGEHVIVTYGAHFDVETLEVLAAFPEAAPFEQVQLRMMSEDNGGDDDAITLRRGETRKIARPLATSGVTQIRVEPPFQPSSHGMGDDRRILGCVCESVRLVGPGKSIDLLD